MKGYHFMLLNLTDVLLEGRKVETEVPIGLEKLEYSFGSYPVTEKSSAFLILNKKESGHLEIRGKASMKVQIPCDRCLDSVIVPFELDFCEAVAVSEAEGQEVDSEGSEAEMADEPVLDPDCLIEGYHLDVDKLLFGEALLNWPSRVLCKEDCKGLCPVCGQNLNHGDCGCERKALDPRMAKVLDVFSKFKEV